MTEKTKSYYVDVFEKDGIYTIILNDGIGFETLIKMKKDIALDLRDKLNIVLPKKECEIRRCSECGFVLGDKGLCQNVNCEIYQWEPVKGTLYD